MIEKSVTDSSAITGYAYDERTWDFTVIWRGRGRTTYEDFPPAMLTDFEASKSKGKYLNDFVVGKFKHR